jgi:hypothetical protein
MSTERAKLENTICSHPCGIYYDPLSEGYIDTCEDCHHESQLQEGEELEDTGSRSFYLGQCGLIWAYLL